VKELSGSEEAREELGLSDFKYEFKRKYVWQSKRERELVYSFTGHSVNVPEINKDEIEDGRFWTLAEINKSLGTDVFTPNFEHEFRFLFFGDK
jgi:isopentenyldiphosphate isomerase